MTFSNIVRTFIIVFAIGLILIGLHFSLLRQKQTQKPISGDQFYQQVIPVKLDYRDGTHFIQGSLDLPDPCYDIFTDVQVAESFPEQVQINITTKRQNKPCAAVITTKTFSVSFKASEQAQISTRLNAEPAGMSLMP